MTTTRTRTTVEVLAALGLQYGLARLLGAAASHAEAREERELAGRVPAQRTPDGS